MKRCVQRCRGWLCAAVVVCWLAGVNAQEQSDIVYLSHTDGGTTMLAQVHPSGHTWVRFHSHSERDREVRIYAVLEAALKLPPHAYQRLEGAARDAGAAPGIRADFMLGSFLGITPVVRSNANLDALRFKQFLGLFEAQLNASGAKPRQAWQDVMKELRSAGLGCTSAPKAQANATSRRRPGAGLVVESVEGESCLITPQLSRVLAQNWPDAVQQVVLDVRLLSRTRASPSR